jgi:AraC-like DNA-binding protein
MRKSTPGQRLTKPAYAEMGAELNAQILIHTLSEGENRTAVPGLSLFRNTAPTVCNITSVEPGISFFAQGKKRISIRGTDYVCEPGSFLVASVDLPIRSQIVQATQDVPQLAMRFLFDMRSVREVVSREDLPEVQGSSERRGLALGRATAGLLSAALRLIELLDAPEDIPFLKHLIERELIYRILQTPQGERLRAIATSGNLSQKTAKAITWLSANYAKPLHMEELAEIARMGVSTLHHQFRALTGVSPLQFQKQLRLRVARERMLKDRMDATSAAYEVGYESVSQFNREYSRFFGQPPMRDIKAIRDSKIVAIDAA